MKTIGICAYNEEKSIKKTLKSILPQIEDKDEIIVVASGCTDKTVEKVQEIKNPKIKVIEEKERKGKVSAINKILERAKGDIIVFVDADVLIEKGAIEQLVRHFKDKDIGATSGKMISYKKENFFDKIQDFGFYGLNQQKIKENKEERFYALNGYLAAIRSGIVKKIDEKFLIDDALLGWEIRKKGYRIIYDPEAIVQVQAAQNLSDFIKQKARNRVGWWQLQSKGMSIKDRRNFSQLIFLFKKPYAWLFIPLDLLIWLKAFVDFKRNKSYWQAVKSSKI